jgi:HAD superfamily hydrolase (TIGR01549 family)
MNTPVRGVIFDLDGTLLNSMPLVFQAYAHAVSPFVEALSDDEWRVHMGGPPERILERVLGQPSQVGEALIRLNDYGSVHWRRIQAFEGMKALLDDCSLAGVPVGVWTGRERESTEVLLDEHGIRERLTACICGDDFASHKPDPAGLSAALRALEIEPAAALFIGDADVDVLAGAALGVRTVLITHGLRLDSEVQSRAWRVVDRPMEAYRLLRTELVIPLRST